MPSTTPTPPAIAKLAANSHDWMCRRKRQACTTFVIRFGMIITATANFTSNSMASAGTARIGAPAPVAPFRMPPSARQTKTMAMEEMLKGALGAVGWRAARRDR